MKGFIKFLIVSMILLLVVNGVMYIISVIRGNARSAFRSTTQQVVPQQVIPQQPQQPVAVQPLKIEAIQMPEGKFKMQKGRAVLSVYNVDCGMNDTLPQSAVLTTDWAETDIDHIQLKRLSSKTIFSRCLLLNMKFHIQSEQEGIYMFGLRLKGATNEEAASLRVNGQQVIPFGKGERTASVSLTKGWYDVDLRIFQNRNNPYWEFGYSLLIKKPADREMHAISKDEIYTAEDVKNETPAAKPAQTK